MSDSFIRARVNTELKNEVDIILKDMGLTASKAIQLMYKQISLRRGLPFAIEVPSKESLEETFAKTDRGEELTSYKDSADMFNKLGI